MKKTTQLRQLLAKKKTLVLPGCFDAVSAKVIEKAGFSIAYLSGYGISASLLGMPDVGLATMTELHMVARYTANAVNMPIIADADTGYGNAINVVRCVRDFIQTGVAGIHIEDQVTPKRCGHVSGKELISIEEAVGKCRAAVKARNELDKDFLLIARTDARTAVEGGLDEAVKRANAYLDAGMDVAFVEAPVSLDEIRRVAKEVKGPLLYNASGGATGISPLLSVEELQELGFAFVLYPDVSLSPMLKAIYDVAVDIKKRGNAAWVAFDNGLKGHPMGDVFAFIGFPDVRKMEEEFLPTEEVRKKYESTLGYKL
jgi:2-methylisocitrate lyase-like PEP mutase family enzyme